MLCYCYIVHPCMHVHFVGREFSTQSVLCEFVDDGCTTEYYVLQNETHFALVVIREESEC